MTRSDLFSNQMLMEDSLLNSCFSGKFLIISKCSKCEALDFESDDFLSLNLDVFTTNDTDHIKDLRKNTTSDSKEKKKGISGLLKSMSSSTINQIRLAVSKK